MCISIIKRGVYLSKEQGVFIALLKGVKFFWARTIGGIGSALYVTNSYEYWNFRMKYDWNFVGGGEQTMYFTAGMFANVQFDDLRQIKTVLDYGCATGDSAIILKIFLPKAQIYLHDISEVGVRKAIAKYSRFIPVSKHLGSTKYELVYSSNVIEHVDDPKAFVSELVSLSEKYIVIQCPWEESHPTNGGDISPNNPSNEHKWTINDDFFNLYIKNEHVEWSFTKGEVPMAWQGGIQAFFLGKIINK